MSCTRTLPKMTYNLKPGLFRNEQLNLQNEVKSPQDNIYRVKIPKVMKNLCNMQPKIMHYSMKSGIASQ